jgi:uncharacterized MAPEG superfamily protein
MAEAPALVKAYARHQIRRHSIPTARSRTKFVQSFQFESSRMQIEIAILLGVCVYGAAQALLTGSFASLLQIHRNFSETSFLFAASVLGLSAVNGFGPWSLKGAAAYAAGRTLYVLFSVAPLRTYRKWAWAASIAGIVGCLAELARATAA